MYSVLSHAQIPFSCLISSNKNTACGVIRDIVHRHNHGLLIFTMSCRFIAQEHVQFHLRPQKKSVISPGPIFTRLKNRQLLDLQIVSPKLVSKRGQHGQKLIYGPKDGLRFPQTALPSAKRREPKLKYTS
jgi:hypothetical protein